MRPVPPPPPSGCSPPPYCQAGWWHPAYCNRQSLVQARRAVRPCSLPGSGEQPDPLEVGVGIRGGSQIVGHALQAGIAADPGYVPVQIDWQNVFNTLRRARMLASVTALPGSATPGDMGLQAAQPPARPPGARSHNALPERLAVRRPPGAAALCTRHWNRLLRDGPGEILGVR
jgi:hypothetical protein